MEQFQIAMVRVVPFKCVIIKHSNSIVEPTEPSLEVIVSGQAVNTVMVGDYVLVNCQPRGGHPLPDVSISMNGVQEHTSVGRKDQTSFSFTATEDDDGKMILCSAINKVGDSSSSTLLHVEGQVFYIYQNCP